MSDLILTGLILAFFAVSLGLVAACQRWMEQ
jgi:hypothetical protein